MYQQQEGDKNFLARRYIWRVTQPRFESYYSPDKKVERAGVREKKEEKVKEDGIGRGGS